MAIATTITLAGISYDVYGLTSSPVVDADSYLNAKLGATTWAAASADDKARALVSAARWLDRVSAFSGDKTSASQALEWPRDGAYCGTTAIADGTIPDAVAQAEFELAFILIGDSSAQDASGQGSNVKRVKAGSAEVEFFDATIGTFDDTRLPTAAHDLLKCLFSGASTNLGGGTAYGTDGDSSFTEEDYGRSGGYY